MWSWCAESKASRAEHQDRGVWALKDFDGGELLHPLGLLYEKEINFCPVEATAL